jgi:hypothetical protein
VQLLQAHLFVTLYIQAGSPSSGWIFYEPGTCSGLIGIGHHLEAMYPHIPISNIANPSPQLFLINLLSHPITHYIELFSNSIVSPRCPSVVNEAEIFA